MPHEIPPDRMDEITAAIYAGRKIEAIKIYRAETNEGLKEAKEFVEVLTARLRQENPEQFVRAQSGGCAGVLLAVGVVAGGAWQLLVG